MAFLSSFGPASGDGHPGPGLAILPARRFPPLGPEPTVLVVGYPAPAAVQIVERLLATDARTIACVVSHSQRSQATRMHCRAQETGRLRLFEGSAATPGLGLPCTAWRILDTTDEIYGVASPQDIATGHIQDFADECPQLSELHLVNSEPTAVPATSKRKGLGRLLKLRSRSRHTG